MPSLELNRRFNSAPSHHPTLTRIKQGFLSLALHSEGLSKTWNKTSWSGFNLSQGGKNTTGRTRQAHANGQPCHPLWPWRGFEAAGRVKERETRRTCRAGCTLVGTTGLAPPPRLMEFLFSAGCEHEAGWKPSDGTGSKFIGHCVRFLNFLRVLPECLGNHEGELRPESVGDLRLGSVSISACRFAMKRSSSLSCAVSGLD